MLSSRVHVALHPSPFVVLVSSQDSGVSIIPSPQTTVAVPSIRSPALLTGAQIGVPDISIGVTSKYTLLPASSAVGV